MKKKLFLFLTVFFVSTINAKSFCILKVEPSVFNESISFDLPKINYDKRLNTSPKFTGFHSDVTTGARRDYKFTRINPLIDFGIMIANENKEWEAIEVSIPDTNFEQALIDLGLDTNGLNGNILKGEAEAITQTLKVSGLGIANLTGIEAFINITGLDVRNNNLTTVDLSKNTKLAWLSISQNKLTSLDISALSSLESVYAGENKITSIDVSSNVVLKKLWLNINELTSIDISSNTLLEELQLDWNYGLTSIDFTNNLKLNRIHIWKTAMSTIDVTMLTALTRLYISETKLTSIDLSKNTKFVDFRGNTNTITSFDFSNNTELERIDVENCKLTNLDVSKNIKLKRFNASNNQLSGIDLTNNPELVIVWVEGNQLTSINLSNNPSIDNLAVGINPLTSLNVSKQVAMRNLTTEKTHISAIDLSTNINLQQLWIAENTNLTALNLSNNPKIWNLGVYQTNIVELDLGIQPIKKLLANDNPSLTKINLANGFNGLITDIYLNNNPNLTCVQVDDVNAATTKWTNVDNASIFNIDCGYKQPELIAITDVNLEQALIDLRFDKNGLSGNILKSDAEAITQTLKVSGLGISDLTGIEAFINITGLDVRNNNLTTVDVSKNTKLTYLSISQNKLTSLDISALTSLEAVYAGENKITSIDVSNNVLLKKLWVNINELTSIDISSNTLLEELELDWNYGLTSIDFTNNLKLNRIHIWKTAMSTIDVTMLTALTRLYISETKLTSIDLSKNTKLVDFRGNTNTITSFDFSNNTELERIDVENCKLTNLDVSKNTKLKQLLGSKNKFSGVDISKNLLLEELFLNNNALINIDINQNKNLKKIYLNDNSLERAYLKNGNNALITEFNISVNPKLVCVAVDDVLFSNTNWTNKDAATTYSTDCNAEWQVYTKDTSLDASLNKIPGLDNDGDGKITYQEAQAFTGDLDLSGQNITDATGLEAFLNAASINISGNSITDIINLLNSSSIIVTSKSTGQKRSIARDNSKGFKKLNVANNLIQEIDISNVSSITELIVSNNRLIYLNLNNNSNTTLLKFDATGNPNLNCIQVDNVSASNSNANWKKDAKASYNTYCSKSALNLNNLLKENIAIYPNPAITNFEVSLTNNLELKLIEIYNLVGKRISTSKIKIVDVSNLSNGMYFVKVVTDKGFIIRKLIIK